MRFMADREEKKNEVLKEQSGLRHLRNRYDKGSGKGADSLRISQQVTTRLSLRSIGNRLKSQTRLEASTCLCCKCCQIC